MTATSLVSSLVLDSLRATGQGRPTSHDRARPFFAPFFDSAQINFSFSIAIEKPYPDYCDTKNRIIAILKLFPPKGGKIISVTQCRGPECGQNHPFFYSLLNFSKLMFP